MIVSGGQRAVRAQGSELLRISHARLHTLHCRLRATVSGSGRFCRRRRQQASGSASARSALHTSASPASIESQSTPEQQSLTRDWKSHWSGLGLGLGLGLAAGRATGPVGESLDLVNAKRSV